MRSVPIGFGAQSQRNSKPSNGAGLVVGILHDGVLELNEPYSTGFNSALHRVPRRSPVPLSIIQEGLWSAQRNLLVISTPGPSANANAFGFSIETVTIRSSLSSLSSVWFLVAES